MEAISPGRIIPPGLFFYARLSANAIIFIRLRIFHVDVYPFAHIIRRVSSDHEDGSGLIWIAVKPDDSQSSREAVM